MNWAELSYELGRVVLVQDFIGPSRLVRIVFGPSCPAPGSMVHLKKKVSSGKGRYPETLDFFC